MRKCLSTRSSGQWAASSYSFWWVSLALLLNQEFKGRAFFRSIILVLPWATPDIVVGVAWQWMYNDMYGVLNDILFRLGIIDYYLPWLADQNLAALR